MRHLCGEIVPESISAMAIGPKMALSDMPAYPLAEHTVRPISTSFADLQASSRPDITAEILFLVCHADPNGKAGEQMHHSSISI